MRTEILYERKKLPVWTVTRRSYDLAWTHARLLTVPFLLVLAAQIVAALGSGASRAILAAPWATLVGLGLMVLFALVMMSFIVGLHRTVLLDEIREGSGFLRWDSNLWKYIKAALTVLLFSLAASIVFGLALIVVFGAGGLMATFLLHRAVLFGILSLPFLLGLFIMLKIGLAFPAAALGYSDVFYLSWRLTAGNLPRLLAVFLLTYLPFLLISLLISLLLLRVAMMPLSSLPFDFLILAVGLAGEIISAASISVMTVALSLSFFFLFKVADDAGEFSR